MKMNMSASAEEKSNTKQLSESSAQELKVTEKTMKKSSSLSNISKTFSKDKDDFENGESPWKSLWICNFIQLLCGVQFGVYFTSMWPYLSGLDHEVAFSFVGIITSVYSVGQSVASPLFGWWSQKTKSTKGPVVFGLFLTAVGNLLYALLPTIKTDVKWYMLIARLIVGLGSGNLGVLRAYTSTASTSKDRNKAMAVGIAAFVFGQSLGPAVQALFSPIKEVGTFIGPLQFNMYTIPAYFMILLSILSTILLYISFEERYAGILVRDKERDHFVALPKFDRIAAGVMIYMWYVQQSSITTTEIIASPLTIAMYDWDDSTAILYNGFIQTASCGLSVLNYFAIAYTRVGNLGNRKVMVWAIVLFIIHYLINEPWPFYPERFDYIKLAPNSTEENTAYSGGCYRRYTWCDFTTRTPLYLYLFSVIFVYGMAFPYFATPTGTIFSQILGPRNQGFMQGIFTFFGSVSRCIMPLIVTYFFEQWGYLWINFLQFAQYMLGLVLAIIFYKRLVPLKIVPKTGVPTRYKHGTFYHL